MTASTPGSARTDSERALVVGGAGRGGDVDRVGHAQAGRGAGVRALHPEPARVGHDRDAVAARQRLADEQRGEVEHLSQRVGPDHAGVAEQRVDVRVGGREQPAGLRRVRPRRRRRAAALDRDHRLVGRHAPSDLPEAARIAERLEVEQHHVGAGVGLPVLQQVVARQVRLGAHRDERRQADAALRGEVQRGDPERAALGGERDPTRGGPRGRERGVERDRGVGVDHAEAVAARPAASRRRGRSRPAARCRPGRCPPAAPRARARRRAGRTRALPAGPRRARVRARRARRPPARRRSCGPSRRRREPRRRPAPRAARR